MSKPQFSAAYVQALIAYSRMVSRSKLRKATQITGYLNAITTTEGGTETYSPEDITITDRTILKTLGHRALQLALQIIEELQFNNALWYFDHTTNKRDAAAIKELRAKNILYPTEDTRIHFVNPEMIRRGNKFLVAGNTAFITSTGKVCKEMIKPLNRKNIEINPIHLAEIA